MAPVTCLCVLIYLRKMRLERAKMAFLSLARAETGARGKYLLWGGSAQKKRDFDRAKIVFFVLVYLVLLHLLGAPVRTIQGWQV